MAQATTLEKLQTLWHYRPDYAYRPNLFQYTDGYTTDPNYVVSEVSMMSPGWQHAETLDQVRQALHILTQFCEPPIHVSREVALPGFRGRWLPRTRTAPLPLWCLAWQCGAVPRPP